MTRQQVSTELVRVIRNSLSIEAAMEIDEATVFGKDIELDSIDIAQLSLDLENEFDFVLNNTGKWFDIANMTVGELVEFIMKELAKQTA